MLSVSSLLRLLLDFLFPVFCLCCRKEGSFLCEGCNGHLLAGLSPKVEILDGPIRQILSATPYREGELLPRLIHSLKYENIQNLAIPLGGLLAHAVKEHPFPSDSILVPVPLHPSRLKTRGYNQAELISIHASRTLQFTVVRLLKRVHFHKPQMELTRHERLKNVHDAFTLDQQAISDFFRSLPVDPASIHVILVDDVATTLATLMDCAHALQSAGFRDISALTLARVY